MLRQRLAAAGYHSRFDVTSTGDGEVGERGRQVVDVGVAVAHEQNAGAGRRVRSGAAFWRPGRAAPDGQQRDSEQQRGDAQWSAARRIHTHIVESVRRARAGTVVRADRPDRSVESEHSRARETTSYA